MTCNRETYISVQPDEDQPPHRWLFVEECNGPDGCGYSAPYLDEDGDPLRMDDGPSITSGEMAAAHARHMAFAGSPVARTCAGGTCALRVSAREDHDFVMPDYGYVR